jgi:dihydroanticapsin dehydrogenase
MRNLQRRRAEPPTRVLPHDGPARRSASLGQDRLDTGPPVAAARDPRRLAGRPRRTVQRVNVAGPFLLAKTTLPYLKARPHPTFTLIGSDSGFVAVPGMLAYNSSKGALVQLTRALSVELHEPFGVRVNSVCPSIVDTPMARDGMGIESFADVGYPVSAPEDIAWLVLSLASPRSVAVTGVSLLADYGYHARSSFPA